jgi:hypothetical protein
MCQQGKMQKWMQGLLLTVFAALSVINLSACTSPIKPTSVQKTRGETPSKSESKYSNMLSDSGRFRALLIGNQNYKYLNKLETPIADVTEIAKVLKEAYGFEIEGPLLDANKQQIMQAIAKISNTMNRENDSVLIYYAGHGAVASNDVGYWQPTDAKDSAVDRYDFVNWISSQEITNILKAMQAKHVIVVADSCYAGRIFSDRGDSSAGKPIPDVGWVKWLDAMQRMRSRTALTAGGDEPVVDSDGSGHSVFAKALLNVLRENREIIDGNTLFDRLKRKVVANRDITQIPHYNYIDKAVIKQEGNQGDFLFVHKDHPAINNLTEPAQQIQDHLMRVSIIVPPPPPPSTLSSIKIVYNPSQFALAQQISKELQESNFSTRLEIFDTWNTVALRNGLTSREIPLGAYTIFFPASLQESIGNVSQIVTPLLPDGNLTEKSLYEKHIFEGASIGADEAMIVLK